MVDTTHYASDENHEGEYIPKSYQFERDMDYTPIDDRFDSLEFDDESNTHFVFPSMEELLENPGKLKDMINTFIGEQKERIQILDGYSKGQNYSILAGRRRLEKEKSDYRIRHNWGGYIANFITGYLLGNPVTVAGDIDMDEINAINKENDIDTLNFELAFDASRFGRAFELHYRGADSRDNIVLINPEEMFVIRDITVNKNIIGAVHCPVYDDKYYVTVYTDKEVISYEPTTETSLSFRIAKRRRHDYQDVPVVEWWNNRFRMGDFESELSTIDAYDAAQSDTANYMSDLNDAMLVINGDLNAAGIGVSEAEQMKRANLLLLESGMDHTGKQTNLSAEYIYKQYDVSGVEAYKTRILKDIYKLTKIPNLDDEHFAGNQSGEALKHKLIGLEQIRVSKESFFTRALRRRYQLISNVHQSLNTAPIDVQAMTFTFHPNLPSDVWAEVAQYISAGGEVSQETLRELASFTDNDIESQRINKESIRPNATDEERQFYLGGLNEG